MVVNLFYCEYRMFQSKLSFTDAHVAIEELQIERPERSCEQWFSQPWDEVVAAHLRYQQDMITLFDHFGTRTNGFIQKPFVSRTWSLPIPVAICRLVLFPCVAKFEHIKKIEVPLSPKLHNASL